MIAIIIIISPHYSYTHQKKKSETIHSPFLKKLLARFVLPEAEAVCTFLSFYQPAPTFHY